MDYISIRDAAERLDVSHKVIRRLIAQGAIAAQKFHGAHGAEWRVETGSLDAYAASASVPRPINTRVRRPSVPNASMASGCASDEPADELEALRADKRFLCRQIESLTELLHGALGTERPPSEAAHTPATGDVTQALQSSLLSIGEDAVRSVELCSVKVLWGNPVLWRVAAEEPDDVARLMEAILSPAATWAPPGEEVVFVWALDGAGSVLWGAACGPGWFGQGFEAALRECRVVRR